MSKNQNPAACGAHKTSIGGQALMEGIMMRGPKGAAVAIHHSDGSIDVKLEEEKHFSDKHKWAKKPILRGMVNFIESLVYGYKYLMYSANEIELDDDSPIEEEPSKLDKWIEAHFGPKMIAVIGVISMILGFALAFVLFMWFPAWSVDMFDFHVTNHVLDNHSLHPLFEGIIRVIILILYMWLVGKNKDIHRVFKYHGAEHKTISTYERGAELTVENVRESSRFHPRCGTNFMFLMLIIAILLSTIVAVIWPGIQNPRWLWILIKLLLIPLVMGIGYEIIRYAGKHDNKFAAVMVAPGMWMQRITTVEPDDEMIETAIAAFNAVRTENPEDDAIPDTKKAKKAKKAEKAEETSVKAEPVATTVDAEEVTAEPVTEAED